MPSDKFLMPTIGFSTNVFDNPADVPGSIRDLATQFKVVELEIAEEAEKVIFDFNGSIAY